MSRPRRLVFGIGRFRPIDIAVFTGVNILVGLYVWKPFVTEIHNKDTSITSNNQSENQTNLTDLIKQK